MKILHFGRFYNNNFGGIERHVITLLKALSETYVVANLVAHERWASEKIQASGCPIPIYKVPSLGLFAGTAICPTMPWVARRLCLEDRYDIVHLHFPDPMSHFAAYFLPSNVKLVISWHSDIIRQKNLLRIYRPFLSHILRRADAIVAATPEHFASSTQIPSDIPRDRLHVVPYGVNFSPLDNKAAIVQSQVIRQKFPGKKLIFAVGRHVYYKGFEYLIRAMSELPDALLLLGGRGPLSDSLAHLAGSLGLHDRVVFLGRIPDEDLPAYYHAADVFCMPSVDPSEAFGLVQAEAMACCKPVVCCNLRNGVTYVNRHEETGIVVPPRDPKALAVALKKLIEDDALGRLMGLAANRRVRSEFTIQAMCQGTFSVYELVLSKSIGS